MTFSNAPLKKSSNFKRASFHLTEKRGRIISSPEHEIPRSWRVELSGLGVSALFRDLYNRGIFPNRMHDYRRHVYMISGKDVYHGTIMVITWEGDVLTTKKKKRELIADVVGIGALYKVNKNKFLSCL